ncbi:MAG: 7TM-DISM domain-containing protein, partial [Leptospiraceae bacterium]|nr:7TM-DISM domain-containing protein [Leptospiraceae bacterium]
MFRGRTYLPVIILVWSGLVTACESRSNVPIEKWEHRRADQTEFTTINRPWNPLNHQGTELHFFQARLPIFAYTEPYLYLENVDEVFEVRLNGRPIYRSGNPDSAHFTYPGAPWHLIQLQSARPSDLIELHVRSAHVNLGVLGVPAIVSYREHLGAMFRTDADRIFVSSTLLFIGIFLIGLALAIRREYAAFLYLGLFSCLMGTWIFGTTHVKQLLWNAPIFWKYIEYTSLYLIPVAIAVFLQKTIQRKSRKYLRFITFSHLLFTIAALSLALTGTVRITTTLLPFNYLMLFSMITFLALLIYWNRMGDHAARYFLYGSLFLIIFAVHDILANLDLIAWNRAFSHWGALAFTISLS